MESDDFLNIQTPENVVFGYEVAGIGSRFLAAMVDTILIVIAEFILFFVLALALRGMGGVDEISPWIAAVGGLLAFAILWGYYIVFELAWNGQTPGKRWAKIRVIRTDGMPITLAESVIRNLVRLVDFLPASYGVGVVTMFVNEQSRRLGDLAAGTVVVREQTAVSLDTLSKPATIHLHGFRAPTAEERAAWPLERLTEQEVEMAEDFLRRRDDLPDPYSLAHRILQMLYKRMGLPPTTPQGSADIKMVAAIVIAYRQPKEAKPVDSF
jgi:uncharacterized RDD family membrane protein YckC